MMQDLTELIRQWATDKNLQKAQPEKQVIKLGEEFGELCQGMAKDNAVQVYDSIGDMYVVLTILCMQLGISIEQCVSYAYDEIKNRTGEMRNGVFVKAADLSGWRCDKSPTLECEYENPETGEYDPDQCIYCGEPEERK